MSGKNDCPNCGCDLTPLVGSLRDHFAMAALGRMVEPGSGYRNSEYAKRAYEIADAMLKAREAPHDEK